MENNGQPVKHLAILIALIVANHLLFKFGRLSYLLFPLAGTILYHGLQIISSTYAGWIAARFLSQTLAIAAVAGVVAYFVSQLVVPAIGQFILGEKLILAEDQDEHRQLIFYSILLLSPLAAVLGFVGGKLALSQVDNQDKLIKLDK